MADAGLLAITDTCKSDFHHMPYGDNELDAAYAIEATCHSPTRAKCYAEAFRVIKPGAWFVAYEWVMTPNYDPNNAKHVDIRKAIELGNGLPPILTIGDVEAALKEAGFQNIETNDLAADMQRFPVTWYDSLVGGMTVTGFNRSTLGRWVTNKGVSCMETLRLAPKGTTAVSEFLNIGADALVEGGRLQIFTPCLFLMAQKPLES
eukprot:NODE_5010_length_732_cov_82.480992_g4987_i0.p1 GENE.NODE_5010_length_732_cov_82.480992_g4987_i0~~NODE_5010_length_732_cov_82.480992_g4987_i0.p1  ORF type:complete len:222 (+),score=73.71 NODE_5010_length_732_cov_82.480992_g4987_i0:52-666(+)